jgi:phosphatidylglycerophosphatase A
MMRIAIKLKLKPSDNQIGTKSRAKAEPKVPGAAKVLDVHDDGRIVWDEFAGQSITLLPLIFFNIMYKYKFPPMTWWG